MQRSLQKITFKDGPTVTRVGLGGEGILRTFGRGNEAQSVILAALEQGITYFDSARVYADSETYYGAVWALDPERRNRIFQAGKSAERTREGARLNLHETLQRLQTDYLDLWQIHDVRTESDLDRIAGAGGALEAFVEAKESGRVRQIGVTGHHDPAILTRAVSEWPVDAVMMPVNPVEGILGGFLTDTLPAARSKDMMVIGMKILGAGHYLAPEKGVTADVLIRYALAQDIDIAIVGCSDFMEVSDLAQAGQPAPPLPRTDIEGLLDLFRPHAPRLAFYRGR